MYCPKCGNFNPDPSHFCGRCGTPLSSPPQDQTVLPPFQNGAYPPSQATLRGEKINFIQEEPPLEAPPTPPVPPTGETFFHPQPVANPGQPPKQEKPKKPKKALVWVLVALVILAGIGVGGWFGWNAYQGNQFQEQLSLGEKYLKELNYEDAVVSLKRAIEIDPRNPEPYLLLADVYVAQEDYSSALDVLEEGYEATGGNEEIKKKQEEVEKQKEEAEKLAEEQKKQEEEKNRSAVEIWEELIQSGQYQQYVSDWEDLSQEPVLPQEYAILDINGDNWEELILSGEYNSSDLSRQALLSCDKSTGEISIIPIQQSEETTQGFFTLMSYPEFFYSPKYHAFIFREEHFPSNVSLTYFIFKDQKLQSDFSISSSSEDGTETFSFYQNNAFKTISKSEYESYLNESQPIEFKEIPASSSENPATEAELSADELAKYEALLNSEDSPENNCCLTNYYASPQQFNPNRILLAGMPWLNSQITDEDLQELSDMGYRTDMPQARFVKWTTSDIDDVLQKTIGLKLSDLQTQIDYDYSAKTDSYYTVISDLNYEMHSELNIETVEVLYGRKTGEDTYCIGYTQGPTVTLDDSDTTTKEVVFKDVNGELLFISNQKVE